MVGLLRPRTVYLKSNECALFSVSLRCDFSVSSSPYCTPLFQYFKFCIVWPHRAMGQPVL